MRDSAIVVGGGICGLMAALLLKQSFKKVMIIEQSERVGGLFCSVKDDSGAHYDMGSHIPNETGINELDTLLFGELESREHYWHVIEKLQSGNYFAGEWDLNSPFPDSHKLASEVYYQGCAELIQATSASGSPLILSYCEETLGKTFTQHIIKPILYKLYGKHTDLNTLTVAAGLFGFTRILAFEPDVANALKNIPTFDAKIGYQTQAHFHERQSKDNSKTPNYFYPLENKGIEAWVEYLVTKVKGAGVDIILSSSIEKIETNERQITGVKLVNKAEVLDCQLLFWSAPPFIALKALGLPLIFNKPELRTAIVFHLNFDLPLLDQKSHYLWVWDYQTDIFRLTLYPNLSTKSQHANLSAEILCRPEEVEQYDVDEIVTRLKKMHVVGEGATCISHVKQVIHGTFPVPTLEFEKNNQANFDTLKNSVDNIIISGRSGGKQWRQADVLVAAYNDINNYLSTE